MGLIIGSSIPMLKRGYPTVSDKYNVQGGTLAGIVPAHFGDAVQYVGGYYQTIGTGATITDPKQIAGWVVATNVKLNETFGGEDVETKPGEAFNLMVSGYIALPATLTTPANMKYGDPVYVSSTGVVSNTAGSGAFATAVPNMMFTGTWELQKDGSYLAEVLMGAPVGI